MRIVAILSSFCRNIFRRARVDQDLDDEVQAAFSLLVEEHVAAGMTIDGARRRATLELGRPDALTEQVRSIRAGAFIDTISQDVRYALRSLGRTPGFSAAAMLTLALGIGANATIFTLLDAVLFKPLPVPAAHELVALYEIGPEGPADPAGGTGRFLRFSFPRFERLQQATPAPSALAAVTRTTRLVARLPGRDRPFPVAAQMVSANYFDMLGVPAARGRRLTAPDVRVGQAQNAAVIGDGFWRRSFGASADIVGQQIALNGVPVTIVGVMPPGFVGTWTDSEPELWIPLTLQDALQYQNNASSYAGVDRNQPWMGADRIAWLNLVGRIAPADLPRVTASLRAANQAGLADLAAQFDSASERTPMLAHSLAVAPLATGFSGLRTRFAKPLFALAAIVAIVLLVTCANVANLLLARAVGRARDLAIRLALGATTARLLQQCLIESLILAAAGGAAGLAGGLWASEYLAREVLGSSGSLPPAFAVDARVLMFAAGLSLVTALAFGVGPALRSIRVGRIDGLHLSERGSSASVARGMRPLVAGQLALSVMVVVVAILLGKTLAALVRIDPGFATNELVSASFDPVTSGYQRDQIPALGRSLVVAVEAVPGVRSASVAFCGLVANCTGSSGFTIEGGFNGVTLHNNWVGPRYFATTGIGLLRGREFDERDTAAAVRVAIVSESIAQRYFPADDALGKHLGFDAVDAVIVGIVREARSITLHEPPVPMVYFPIDQPPPFRTYPNALEVRVAGQAGGAAATIRDAIQRAEPALIVNNVSPMSQHLARDIVSERLVAVLALAFAVLALFLASLGLYGVLSYSVAGRTREIGVRIALGALPRDVAAMVVRDALRVVAAGLAIGLPLTFGAVRVIRSVLVELSQTDLLPYVLVVGVLVAVSLVAAFLPARRAVSIDPMRALRSE